MAGKAKSSERATEAQAAQTHVTALSRVVTGLPWGPQGRGWRRLTGHQHAQRLPAGAGGATPSRPLRRRPWGLGSCVYVTACMCVHTCVCVRARMPVSITSVHLRTHT